ncbi:MAG: bifunctional aspartate kinase/homoserine dehydrogenase I [Rikenellaceae bacterium]
MQILKFGGSSVADAYNISNVVNIVKESVKKERTIVVISAISGCTNRLIEIGRRASVQDNNYTKLIDDLEQQHLIIIDELIPLDFQPSIELKIKNLFNQLREICKGVYYLKELSNYSLDLIMSFGEIISTKIISVKFISVGINNLWVDARDLIKTDLQNSQNIVDTEASYANVKKFIGGQKARLYIIPGFIASDSCKRATTLGRGGSDYTASLLAVATEARVLEIWSDVNGMMTADPRIVPDARTIDHISYKEALELSHFGAKVVYPPTIQPVISKEIPIVVKNTFAPKDAGTVIENSPPESQGKIKGISCCNKIALLSMEGSGMVGVPGYSSKLFDALTKAAINIILITQASSVHTMCVAIDELDSEKAKQAADYAFAYEISLDKVNPLKVERGFSIITLVGDDMKNQSGTSGKMFNALGRAGINIRAIAQGSSEKNISTVVLQEDSDEAIRVIHKEFFGESVKRINLFIAGHGNVAKSLISIIESQSSYISKAYKSDISIVGICNSRKMIFNRGGIVPGSIPELLKKGNESGIYKFCEKSHEMGLSNSVFVDCTAHQTVASTYQEFFSNGISVVTCNKIAISSSMDNYKSLKESVQSGEALFFYETTAGAALPVISTIQQMIQSGDKIESIEAILSGTLNYLFSKYDGSESFSSLLRKAQALGYTEQDPKLDLSGTDVLRKTLILSREIGLETEAADIKPEPILSKSILSSDGEDFYKKLEESENKISEIYKESQSKGERLRYIATIREGGCKIGLESLNSSHPLYDISGTDNAVIIHSRDYPSPIRIVGADAGARQTATGLFNDILKIRR